MTSYVQGDIQNKKRYKYEYQKKYLIMGATINKPRYRKINA